MILFQFTLSIKLVIAEACAFKSFVLFFLIFLHTFRGGAVRLDDRSRKFLLVKVFLSISVQVIYKA